MNTRRHAGAALGTLLALVIPAAALAQSTSPSAGSVTGSPAPSIAPGGTADPGASVGPGGSPAPASTIREGWALIARDDPAMSLQLPPGWAETAGPADIHADGPDGETLLVFFRPVQDPDFDAYVTRIERVEERDRRPRREVATTFRMAGTGLVARLDRGLGAGRQEAKFLFPTCPDGAITLDIVGPAPEATGDGLPDAWDRIAAALNPCSSEPAPELVSSPELTALGQAYVAAATETNAEVGEAYAYFTKPRTLAQWRSRSVVLAEALKRGIERVDALPWTAETRPLGDAIIAAYEDAIGVWGERLAKARSIAVVRRINRSEVGRTGDAIAAAGRQIRLALGLPTSPR